MEAPPELAGLNGLPSKRCIVFAKRREGNAGTRKADWVRLVLRSRDLGAEGGAIKKSRKSSKAIAAETGGRRRAWLFTLAVAVLVAWAVVEACVQQKSSVAAVVGRRRRGTAAPGGDVAAALEGLTNEATTTVRFLPLKLQERLDQQKTALARRRAAATGGVRKPRLALVCADLDPSPEALYLITLWKAIAALGYDLEVFSLGDGAASSAWERSGATVHLRMPGVGIDWSRFDAVILSSLKVDSAIASFRQDPFVEIPVIWVLLEENGEARRRRQGASMSPCQETFNRATVVVLSDYMLAMEYTSCDTGNFFVVPGSPVPAWDAESYMSKHSREEARRSLELGLHDIAIAIVGSNLPYKGVWREHAMAMHALLPISREMQKMGITLNLFFSDAAGLSVDYNASLRTMAAQIGLANGTVAHFQGDGEEERHLWAADLVLYTSQRDQAFPKILSKAMVFSRPIVAPNNTIIRDYIEDGVHGFLYGLEDGHHLSETLRRVVSPSGLADSAHRIGLCCKDYARNLLAGSSISGFAELLESVVQFPSEARLPLPTSSRRDNMRMSWAWQIVDQDSPAKAYTGEHRTGRGVGITRAGAKKSSRVLSEENERISLADWEEVKLLHLEEEMERSEEEQLIERNELLHGSWEELYRSVRKVENARNELHERDDGELERTGQPICIYEPYFGNGTWDLLGQKSITYRGISMIPRQRRPGSDDIEASLRLPLLNESYYQDVLCEFGAFLAIANRIDRIHKNAWIGFQSWQAAGRKVSLSERAEAILREELRKPQNRDTVYFWVSTNHDEGSGRSQHYDDDFWAYCDAINNGGCRDAFLRAFKNMYGLPPSWNALPPMPVDGDSWSVLNAWAMPTPSFMEFIMFSRMFVSALDSEFSSESRCTLGSSLAEAKHCYCRLLQLLINVWAYHSGRGMVFLNPVTGAMREQHDLSRRHQQMWMKFFSFSTLKSMDEDLAEEADDAISLRQRWLWPRTGEVFCQRIYDRERRQRYAMKIEKKKRDKERVKRIRSRQRQRPLAKG